MSLTDIGFARRLINDCEAPLADQEVCDMIDKVIDQTLGPEGLNNLIRRSDRVTIKVNIVGPHQGARGEKGFAIITDPRVVRYVAEKVRKIIGPRGVLKVAGTTHYFDSNPSLKRKPVSFYWAKLGRSGNDSIDPCVDVCYDGNADGILDGTSEAELVNLDSIGESGRFLTTVQLYNEASVTLAFPKFLRTRKEALIAGEPNEYTDVFIGLPIFKTHGIQGMTGAIKLHYGIRNLRGVFSDTGRIGHNGVFFDENGVHKRQNLNDYLCAQHMVRTYDYIIMDALTLNLEGPTTPREGSLNLDTNDEKVNYILTNAMMASRDSVAIDVVATNLMAFDLKSIPYLRDAAENRIGQYNAGYIRIHGDKDFYKLRQHLWERYHPKFPPPERVGAKQLTWEQIAPAFNVILERPEKIGTYLYRLRYKVVLPTGNTNTKIVRVELVVLSQYIIAEQTGDNLVQGELIIDYNQPEFCHLRDTALPIMGRAWDQYFNCLEGATPYPAFLFN